MQPSTARDSGQVDPRRSTTNIPSPQSAALGLHPVARRLLLIVSINRVSIKNKQNYFRYNHVKLPLNLIIFVIKMANSPKLYEVHSFSTSPNSRQCTTVLNAHVQNWYITL